MLVEFLVKRPVRERYALGGIVVVLVAVGCYTAGIQPALSAMARHEDDLQTTEKVLGLQQRQLNLLRAETKASQKTLDDLKDLPCPWVPTEQADMVLQGFQKEAADLGLSVRSVVRESVTGIQLKDAPRQVSVLLVRLELHGPYASVMEMFRRLSKGALAVGLEELSVKGSDEPPYDVDVVLRVRMPVVEGEKP
ncbi:MAG TPA: type II secretion system protein GspM [Phycisphaerae bacterium]|nr:type II secretion system protein GspM [Phycisphaerae bacterium]